MLHTGTTKLQIECIHTTLATPGPATGPALKASVRGFVSEAWVKVSLINSMTEERDVENSI